MPRPEAGGTDAESAGPGDRTQSAGFGCGMSPEPSVTRLPGRRPPPRPPGGRRAGAPPPQSGAQNAFPRRDRCFGSDPKGSRQGCANTPALEPVAGPRTAGSLPTTPSRPAGDGRPGGAAARHCCASGWTSTAVRTGGGSKCASDPHVICALRYGSKSGHGLPSNPPPANCTSCGTVPPCSTGTSWDARLVSPKTKRALAAAQRAAAKSESQTTDRPIGRTISTAVTTATCRSGFDGASGGL